MGLEGAWPTRNGQEIVKKWNEQSLIMTADCSGDHLINAASSSDSKTSRQTDKHRDNAPPPSFQSRNTEAIRSHLATSCFQSEQNMKILSRWSKLFRLVLSIFKDSRVPRWAQTLQTSENLPLPAELLTGACYELGKDTSRRMTVLWLSVSHKLSQSWRRKTFPF